MSAVFEEARQAERQRHKEILNHPNVSSGAATDLAVFIIVETDLSPAEAYLMLDKALPPPPANAIGN